MANERFENLPERNKYKHASTDLIASKAGIRRRKEYIKEDVNPYVQADIL
ncbi:hypothetical protein LQE92_01900 [Lacrimispora sp. NSJ-141]|uniref:Uncharacterized protein n=1 Tax=Lientehia hominis TaxID=2897778 RepID=A0AAP2W7T4_9FIRM|nr:hypothetical protein [Lientehia hominis]MCD2491380.1 hypothetical protein [Lientehia hominis]